MHESIWLWVGFIGFVIAMLALDLGVFNRKAHVISVKEAAIWSVVWISLALLFNVVIYFFWHDLVPTSPLENSEAALYFLTGYVIEKALSVDNIFVFVLIFSYFKVPAIYQHRVLFWGVLGALVMRAFFIIVGSALLERFHWIIYIFGAFLIYTGIKMARGGDENIDPDDNKLVQLTRKIFPVTGEYHGQNFFIRNGGKLFATPLFLVLVLVESTDLIFAVDSIPAIFGIFEQGDTDAFIVFTSNIFAILGLRSLYFVLAGVVDKFHYLKLGLSVVLSFVGVKMLLPLVGFKMPTFVSLGIIIGVLTISIVASLMRAKRLAAVDTPLDNPPRPGPVVEDSKP